MATIVKYCGPGVTSVGDQARSSERERERTTTYVLHYGHTATPRHIAARPTRPLSSLSETDGAWRKNEGPRKREGERVRKSVRESALDEEEGTREKTGRTYRRIHFIGRKNPPGNYRQIYADTRRTTIAKGISRSNVGTRETPTGAVREKRRRTWENKAYVDDKSRLERASLIGYQCCSRRCGETYLVVARLVSCSNLDHG